MGNSVRIEVYDEDLTTTELVGAIRLSFDDLLNTHRGSGPGKPHWRHLYHPFDDRSEPSKYRSEGGRYHGSLLLGLSAVRNDAAIGHVNP